MTSNLQTQFITAVNTLIRDLGLTEWRVIHDEFADQDAGFAHVDFKFSDMMVIISWNTTTTDLEDMNVHKAALHEVLHALLFPLITTAASTADGYHELVLAQEHAVIQRLINLIFMHKDFSWLK